MEIHWNRDEFGVGNDDLDAQHKQLFALTNQYLAWRAAGAARGGQEEVLSILRQLVAYARYHFSTEEALFEHYGFPQTTDHRKAHESFTARIQEAFGTVVEAEGPGAQALEDLLVGWLHSHIQKEDRGYAEYFHAQGLVIDIHFNAGEKAGADSPIREGAKRLWSDKQLGLEIGTIDHQHQELVLILQQASDLLRANDERRKTYLPLILEKLYHYSRYHFLYEEDLMAHHGFTDLEAHRQQHLSYVEKIMEFSRRSATNKQAVNEEIVQFLKHWVVEHILVEDKKFKTEFQKAHPGKTLG